MAPKITHQMREALAQHPGRPLEVEDEQTQKVYMLVDAEQGRMLAEQWIREQLQIGLDAAAKGEVVEFNPDAIKAAGRQRLSSSL